VQGLLAGETEAICRFNEYSRKVPRPLIAISLLFGIVVAVLATSALYLGIQETRLLSAGPRRSFAADELPHDARGFVAVFGCVRHDLAAAVKDGRVFPLGQEASEGAHVFTPLSPVSDCDEGTPPKRIAALIEDDEELANTLGRVYQTRVAPPPVPAFVDGVIGYGAGHFRAAAYARDFLSAHGLDVKEVPLLQKGKRAGVRWVSVTTALVGVHGYLLLLLGVVWVRRRLRRAAGAQA
jgi:hypothetical protein